MFNKWCTFCTDRYSPYVALPLDDVYYRDAAYTLCRVHSGIIRYKSAQTIHDRLTNNINNNINLFLRKSENRMVYDDLSATDLFANTLFGFFKNNY